MKSLKVTGHTEDGEFKAKLITDVALGIVTDDWNTLTNILRIRRKELAAETNECGFVYKFPLSLGE